MEKNITVKKFVDKYNNLIDNGGTNEELCEFIGSHIVNDYVSYAEKIAVCKKIVKITNYKTIEYGDFIKEVWYKDSLNQDFLFIQRLFEYYTDIAFEDNIVDDFDNLNKNNLISLVVSFIPDTEKEEWEKILTIANDDDYVNNTNMISYLNNKSNTIEILINTLVEISNDSNIIDKIKDMIIK